MSKSETDTPSAKSTDWGLNEPQQRAGSQTRIALLMIMTLLGALSFFVYRKYSEHGAGAVHAADFTNPGETNPESETAGDVPGAAPSPGWDGGASGSLDGERDGLFVSGADQTPPIEQSEPPVMDWFSQPIDAQGENGPARDAPPQHLVVEWPGEEQDDRDEPTTADDEAAIDLFADQQEPSSNRSYESRASVAVDPVETSPPDAVNPFLMSTDNDDAATPDDSAAFGTSYVEEPPQPIDDASDPWSGAPALEPLRTVEEESASSLDEEPEVIRVNSDDQTAGFENPFFLDEETPAPAPDRQGMTAEPAAFDFGTPPPAVTPRDDPPSSIDWSSPAAGTGPPADTGFSDPFTAATSSGTATAGSDDSVQVHTVRQGDSYWSIARRHYGAGRYFTALAAYNQSRIADPNNLQLGMKVLIPKAEVLQQRFPALLGGSYVPGRATSLPAGFFMSREGQPMYRVGRNDTLSSIAQAHLGRSSRWRQIYGLNRDRLQNADRLQPGLELRLPSDASQAELVSRPAGFR